VSNDPDVLISFGGEFLALSQDQFQEAVKRGRELMPPKPVAAAQQADTILDAEGMASVTSVPASWFEEKARQGKIPHIRAGKYVRFCLREVLEVLKAQSRHADRLSLDPSNRAANQSVRKARYLSATKKTAA
jgi:hypothetical protein